MGEKKAQNSSGLIRGILVARDSSAKAVAIASVVPNIALKPLKTFTASSDDV
jgi:hypothetical protein